MAGGGSGDGDFGLQIAPMLDILFVLLLFFMVSAGSQKKEAGIITQLPGQGGPSSDVSINIALDATNQVTLNDVPMDVGVTDDNLIQLQAGLTKMLKANPLQPVIIVPDRSATHQHVIDILNACAGAGVKNLAFGTPSG